METPRESKAQRALEELSGRLVSKASFDRQVDITRELINKLHQEIDTQRLVARYLRRQWHQSLFWAILIAVHLRDVAAAYDGLWLAPVFFMSPHGGGVLETPLRIAGGLGQLALAWWFHKRTKVPPWLLDQLTGGSVSVSEYTQKYKIKVGPDRRRKQRFFVGPDRRTPE